MENNLQIWEKVRTVPSTALKAIQAGRLKGKSDINPMWRLKTLTEQFGPCGVGWKYEITEKRLERGAGDEIAAFVDINLYVKVGDVWSEPIPGTGGSSFVANESKGLYTNDECFKMALTDAISVSCKALGFGADVYWDKDRTKYDDKGNNGHGAGNNEPEKPKQSQPNSSGKDHETARKAMYAKAKELKYTDDQIKDYMAAWYSVDSTKKMTVEQLKEFRARLIKQAKEDTA